MRLFALIAMGLMFASVPATADASTVGGNHLWAERSIPGEPPSAILVATGFVGMALVRRRRAALSAIK